MESSFVLLFVALLACLWEFLKRLAPSRLPCKPERPDSNLHCEKPSGTSLLRDLRLFKGHHESADVLLSLIEQDGAGEWPPRVVYDAWPSAVQPYKDIYLELVPMLPCADPLLDDESLSSRRDKFRGAMRDQLRTRINTKDIEDLLNGAEAGNWSRIRRDQLNGVYCAVAVLRHAYRYGYLNLVTHLEETWVLTRLFADGRRSQW